jgi:beta-D-xylosidase 4
MLTGLEGTVSELHDKNATIPKKIIATCKHLAGYDLEDWGGAIRGEYDALITTQDLTEYYLPPFQTCARDQNVGSVMCSYNVWWPKIGSRYGALRLTGC